MTSNEGFDRQPVTTHDLVSAIGTPSGSGRLGILQNGSINMKLVCQTDSKGAVQLDGPLQQRMLLESPVACTCR